MITDEQVKQLRSAICKILELPNDSTGCVVLISEGHEADLTRMFTIGLTTYGIAQVIGAGLATILTAKPNVKCDITSLLEPEVKPS